MSIQIIGLRPYWNEAKKVIDLKEVYFSPRARTVESLFKNIESIIKDIPECERYNLYWTASHCKVGTREMLICKRDFTADKKGMRGQDIVCFDVDKIDIEKIDAYPSIIADAIGVPLKECVVVYTGNGVQIIAKLESLIGFDDYFKNYRDHYKHWCTRIDASIYENGMNGEADTSVWSAARLLRLPLTENRKPLKNTDTELCKKHDKPSELKIKKATLVQANLGEAKFNVYIEGLKQKEKQLITGQHADFTRPDHDTIMKECAFMREALDTHGEYFNEPQWRASLNIASYFEDENKLAHEISNGHKEYTAGETEIKLALCRESAAPHICGHINSVWQKCHTCVHYRKINSPINIKGKLFFIDEMTEPLEDKKLTEMQAVYKLLREFKISFDPDTASVNAKKSDLVKQDDDLYLYCGGYWEMLEDGDLDQIYRVIERMTHYKEKHNTIISIMNKFKKFVPEPPAGIKMKRSFGDKLCLDNGTLHIEKNNGEHSIVLRKHKREDYLVNIIHLEYDENFKEVNTELLDMLDRIFRDDDDKEAKINAIQEMMGSCLMPKFPKIYFLHGGASCGKSTVMICLSNLLNEENIGRIDPSDFKGFLLEPIIGKMVNIVTDIKSDVPIGVNVLKSIEDRVPYAIQRKGKKNVSEPLPALHIFGANSLPRNYETDNDAFDRRAIFIGFKNIMAKKDTDGFYSHDRNFGNDVFNANPQGVLNFALQGLIKICYRNGQYLQPKSGQATMNEWLTEFDVLHHFVEDIKVNEVEGYEDFEPIVDDNLHCRRKVLWPVFSKWLKLSGYRNGINKAKFYKLLVRRFKCFKTNGYIIIKGIGCKNEDENNLSQDTISDAEIGKAGY